VDLPFTAFYVRAEHSGICDTHQTAILDAQLLAVHCCDARSRPKRIHGHGALNDKAVESALSFSNPSSVPCGRSTKTDELGTKTVNGTYLSNRSTSPASFSAMTGFER